MEPCSAEKKVWSASREIMESLETRVRPVGAKSKTLPFCYKTQRCTTSFFFAFFYFCAFLWILSGFDSGPFNGPIQPISGPLDAQAFTLTKEITWHFSFLDRNPSVRFWFFDSFPILCWYFVCQRRILSFSYPLLMYLFISIIILLLMVSLVSIFY